MLMKTLTIGLLAAGLMLPMITGCAAPAYSGGLPTIKFPEEKATGENANRVVRNWHLENRQMIEDINSVLLFDPVSRMSKWHMR
jgi:hypothetical protein